MIILERRDAQVGATSRLREICPSVWNFLLRTVTLVYINLNRLIDAYFGLQTLDLEAGKWSQCGRVGQTNMIGKEVESYNSSYGDER